MRIFLFAVFLLFSVPAFAQNGDKKFCNSIAKYASDDATYKPDVDVNGNEVVPADLGSKIKPVFDPVVIPIEIDLEERFGVDLPDEIGMGHVGLSYIKVYSDGRVEYNDTDVTQQTQELCSTISVNDPKTEHQEQAKQEKPVNAPVAISAPETVVPTASVTNLKPLSADGQEQGSAVVSGGDKYGKPLEGEGQ